MKYLPLLLGNFRSFDAWHPNFALVDEHLMSVAKKREKEVHTWTVNDPNEIKRLIQLEVNSIITDDTSLLK